MENSISPNGNVTSYEAPIAFSLSSAMRGSNFTLPDGTRFEPSASIICAAPCGIDLPSYSKYVIALALKPMTWLRMPCPLQVEHLLVPCPLQVRHCIMPLLRHWSHAT